MKQLTKEQKRRYRAIRKGVQTRRANRAWRERFEKVDRPAMQQLDKFVNWFLRQKPIDLRWAPKYDTGLKLRGNAQYGTLLGVRDGGRTWIVLPEGYKRPHEYHAQFWEPLLP